MDQKIGIIFDMDGTLWDSAANVAASWNEVIALDGRTDRFITEADMKSVMGLTMNALAARLFPELPEDERLELLDRCARHENDYLREKGGRLYPGLEGTLKCLAKSYSLYIVSNCQSGYIEAFLEHYGFGKYFQDIECFGNNGHEKDENIRLIVQRNALTGAIYVGDIDKDYESAKKAGVGFIHAAYGFGIIEEDLPRIQAVTDLPTALCQLFIKE